MGSELLRKNQGLYESMYSLPMFSFSRSNTICFVLSLWTYQIKLEYTRSQHKDADNQLNQNKWAVVIDRVYEPSERNQLRHLLSTS